MRPRWARRAEPTGYRSGAAPPTSNLILAKRCGSGATLGCSIQALARMQRMAGKEFPGAQAPAAFALKRKDAQGLLAACNHNSVLSGLEDFAGLTGSLFGYRRLPDFEQLRPRLSGQK